MGSRVNYTTVGLFVIILTAALIIGIVWLSNGLSKTKYKTYVTYMDESVAGLSDNAPVKYNGVNVGYVEAIRLNPEKPRQVIVYLNINEDVMIRQDSTATLESQGLTGLTYVGLRGGSANSPVLAALPGYEYPIIQSKPSLLMRLDTIVRSLAENVEQVTQAVNHMLNEQNQASFSKTLANLKEVTNVWAQNSEQLDHMIHNFTALSKNLNRSSQQLPHLTYTLQNSLKRFDTMILGINKTSHTLRSTLRQGQNTLQGVSNQLLPQTYLLMKRMSVVGSNLQHFSSELQSNPSILIRGRQPQRLGPGEK